MICECGVDHHAGEHAEVAEAIADAQVEQAEVYAEAETERQEHVEALNEDDNETRVEIARIEAEASTEQTRILADAAVDIAEAEAAADVAAAEVIAGEEPDGDEMPPDDADVELTDEADDVPELEDGTEPTAIAVPPQIAEDRPAAARKSVKMSQFRARKQRR